MSGGQGGKGAGGYGQPQGFAGSPGGGWQYGTVPYGGKKGAPTTSPVGGTMPGGQDAYPSFGGAAPTTISGGYGSNARGTYSADPAPTGGRWAPDPTVGGTNPGYVDVVPTPRTGGSAGGIPGGYPGPTPGGNPHPTPTPIGGHPGPTPPGKPPIIPGGFPGPTPSGGTAWAGGSNTFNEATGGGMMAPPGGYGGMPGSGYGSAGGGGRGGLLGGGFRGRPFNNFGGGMSNNPNDPSHFEANKAAADLWDPNNPAGYFNQAGLTSQPGLADQMGQARSDRAAAWEVQPGQSISATKDAWMQSKMSLPPAQLQAYMDDLYQQMVKESGNGPLHIRFNELQKAGAPFPQNTTGSLPVWGAPGTPGAHEYIPQPQGTGRR